MYTVCPVGVCRALVREMGSGGHHKCNTQCPKECSAHLNQGTTLCMQWCTSETFIREEGLVFPHRWGAELVWDDVSRFVQLPGTPIFTRPSLPPAG